MLLAYTAYLIQDQTRHRRKLVVVVECSQFFVSVLSIVVSLDLQYLK